MEHSHLEESLSRHLFILVYRHLVRIFLHSFPLTSLSPLPRQLNLLLETLETFTASQIRVLFGKVRKVPSDA